MRLVPTVAFCLATLLTARPAAATSCNVPADLCVGDPCVTGNLTVVTPCTLDFGAVALVIGGALTVPAGGMLQLTAASVLVQGRIEAPGGSVTLIANAGDADLNTEIDVGTGSITVEATGNISAKSRLKARPGGSVTLDADGTLETRSTAVVEVQDGGSATLGGGGGATIGGKVFAYGGTVQITSSAGIATIDQEIRLDSAIPGSVTVDGANGVVVNKGIVATKAEPGNTVILQSSAGNVVVGAKVRVSGDNAGSIIVQAPNGTVGLRGFDAKGKFNGGSVSINAATIALEGNIIAKGSNGNGGSIALVASTLVNLAGAGLDATGKVDGGAVIVAGAPASGNVVVDGSSIKVTGGAGPGGVVQVSAPAGSVSLRAKINATSKGAVGGKIFVDGVALTIGPKTTLDVDGRIPGPGEEIRLEQTGAGLFTLNGTCEARDDGVVEALAPAGSLTASGRFRAGPAGCVGLSAGVTLDVSNVVADVPVTPSCP